MDRHMLISVRWRSWLLFTSESEMVGKEFETPKSEIPMGFTLQRKFFRFGLEVGQRASPQPVHCLFLNKESDCLCVPCCLLLSSAALTLRPTFSRPGWGMSSNSVGPSHLNQEVGPKAPTKMQRKSWRKETEQNAFLPHPEIGRSRQVVGGITLNGKKIKT